MACLTYLGVDFSIGTVCVSIGVRSVLGLGGGHNIFSNARAKYARFLKGSRKVQTECH